MDLFMEHVTWKIVSKRSGENCEERCEIKNIPLDDKAWKIHFIDLLQLKTNF